MKTIKTTWGKHEVALTWVPAKEAPAGVTVTSTHGLCFDDGSVFMVNLESRGWDFPGGHMEEGETPEECFAREAMEEACIAGKASMIGYILVDNREDPAFDASKYPEIGCQIYYRMDVETVHPFNQDFESSERLVCFPESVAEIHGNWNEILDSILEEAVESEAA